MVSVKKFKYNDETGPPEILNLNLKKREQKVYFTEQIQCCYCKFFKVLNVV